MLICQSVKYEWTISGKGENIWDTFVRVPDAIYNNDTGDIATDSYHKYPEDINLLRSLKVWIKNIYYYSNPCMTVSAWRYLVDQYISWTLEENVVHTLHTLKNSMFPHSIITQFPLHRATELDYYEPYTKKLILIFLMNH